MPLYAEAIECSAPLLLEIKDATKLTMGQVVSLVLERETFGLKG